MLKKEKNIFEILMISSFIFYSLLLVIFSKDGLPNNLWTQSIFPFLADKPLSEDGFYMLTVAKNIASGNGIVYNFNIPTSGIQPLMTFVYAGIFWITNLFSSSEYFVLRIVLLFSAFLQIIFYFLLKKTLNLFNISSDSRTLVLCSIVLFNFGLFNTFLNGLETSLYLVMIVIFINTLVSVIDKKMSNVYLGIVIGLTVLARVDFILIISAFMLVLLFLKKINLRSLIKVGSIAFIISLPWFIYVYQITDSIIPSSGTAQSSVPQSLSSVFYRINVMFFSILDHSVPWIFASNILLSNLATLVVAIFSTIYIIKKRIYEVLKFDKNEILFYYLFSIIPAIIVYVIFFHSTYFYYRYTVPVVPVFLITVTLIISIIINSNKNLLRTYLSISFIFFSVQFFFVFMEGEVANSHAISARFIKDNFSDTTRIGGLQSGTIGYFNSNVFNLDGKLDPEVLRYLKKDKLHEFVDKRKIDVFIDWRGLERAFDSTYFKNNWQEFEGAKINNDTSSCFVRIIK